MARVKSYTPEQVEFIRERAATMTDPQLGELMGLPGWKVLHIRQREKIRSGRRLPEDVEALANEVIQLYIHEGLTSVETGKRLGISDKAVRMICHKRGLKQPPGHRAANHQKALARINAARALAPRPPKPPKPPKARAPRRAFQRPTEAPVAVEARVSDADLVAAFLARNKVTVCPDGIACGLSQIEQHWHAATPVIQIADRKAILAKNLAAKAAAKRRAA